MSVFFRVRRARANICACVLLLLLLPVVMEFTRATYDSVRERPLSSRRSSARLAKRRYYVSVRFADFCRFMQTRVLCFKREEQRSALPETCALLCPELYDVTDGNSPVRTASAGPTNR